MKHHSIRLLHRTELVVLNRQIKELVLYAVKSNLCKEEDFQYSVNRIIELLDIKEYEDVEVDSIDENTVLRYVTPLLDYAVEKQLIKDTISDRDQLESRIMDTFLPRPSVVSSMFKNLYNNKVEDATEFLYNLSLKSNYIKHDRVSKNILWKSPSKYGEIDMTINVSKPEKTVEEIKKARLESSKYPKCPLCLENVGFAGTDAKPSRHNLRVVPVELNGEEFFLQYSPYVYYNEHSIVFKKQHEPMVIGESTFRRLLDFVEQFPHYFLGSNADLPIVGGSILSHEHYQGGNYEFPLQRAEVIHEEIVDGVTLRRLLWPLTVIQLEGEKETVIKLATKVLNVWKTYSDTEAGILSKTNLEHNTITPIARMKDGKFQIDLALRNNRTSDEYPDGIFHSHPEHHHIKRENLGLIEVMGLSVLPARLVDELTLVKSYLEGEVTDLGLHYEWAKTLSMPEDLDTYILNEVSNKFVSCLEDAGVFKNDKDGDMYFKRFLSVLKNA